MNTPATESMQDRLTEQLTHLSDEADRLVHQAALKGDHEVAAARDRVMLQVQQARAELARIAENAKFTARRAALNSDRAIHEHPYAAIGIAAAIGVLVGAALFLRRD